MENINWLTVTGLIIDLFGAWLLFKYGLPSDMYNRKLNKDELLAEELFWKNQNRARPLKWDEYASEEDKKWAKKVKRRAKIGLTYYNNWIFTSITWNFYHAKPIQLQIQLPV